MGGGGGAPHPEPFVVKRRDPETIEHARRVLSGEETAATHVMGKVHRRGKPWNAPWNYRLVPRTVHFFELAIEVCDAGIGYVEEHLDEVGGAFLPGRIWCPWGSRLMEEIPRPKRRLARRTRRLTPPPVPMTSLS